MIRVVVWGKLAGPPHLTSGVACEQWSRPNIRWSVGQLRCRPLLAAQCGLNRLEGIQVLL